MKGSVGRKLGLDLGGRMVKAPDLGRWKFSDRGKKNLV